MALDAYIGLCATRTLEDAWSVQVLAEVNALLAAVGLPPHQEPAEVSEGGVRLGFYGAAKYDRLDRLLCQLAARGAIEDTTLSSYDTDDALAEHPPARRFAHLEASHGGLSFLVPYVFEAPIRAPQTGKRGEVGTLVSAPQVIAESALFRFCLEGVQAGDWQWWEKTERARALGLTVAEDDVLARMFGAEVDLAWRLSQYAEGVIAAHAIGYVG